MKRWLEDPGLSSELRAELSRSQHAGREYDAYAKLPQLREAFQSTQLTQTELLERDVVAGAGESGGLSGIPFALKLTVSVLVIGAAAYLAWPEAPASQTAQPSAAAPALEPAPALPVHAAKPGLRPASEPTPIQASPPPAAAQPAPVPALRPSERSSRREIAQLVRIRSLLETHPTAAYQLARQSDLEFPHGVLGEERRALQVEALAKSGKAEAAERKAREFFARYPQSPLRERVEAALRR